MGTCFIIQPFDGGKFDKRCEDVFKPAIEAAGLEPYRTDEDPSVETPIEAVEGKIRAATACFADITTDNPNVWYELGYAWACDKPTIMVCSTERQPPKYPFDIQHRTILRYSVDSASDFARLTEQITAAIKARVGKAQELQVIRAADPLQSVEGLSQHELAVLAAIIGDILTPDGAVSAYDAKRQVEAAGFTAVAYGIGVRGLLSKQFVLEKKEESFNGNEYSTLGITPNGWDWVEQNMDKFRATRERNVKDDIPF